MRSAKELAAGLRALHTNNDDTRAFLREAADYIERAAPPADGLVLETTAEERAHLAYEHAEGSAYHRDDRGEILAMLRDLDKAVAFAASETKRADEEAAARREADERAEQAEAREATLREALEGIADSITRGFETTPDNGPHRMLVGDVWHTGPAVDMCRDILREIESIARAALATTSTGEDS